MMYASKITVNNEPLKIAYHKQVELPDKRLSIKDISKHLKEGETFDFQEKEENQFSGITVMNIYGYRNETKQEVKIRVAKEVAYNEAYEKHHLKYPRNRG